MVPRCDVKVEIHDDPKVLEECFSLFKRYYMTIIMFIKYTNL